MMYNVNGRAHHGRQIGEEGNDDNVAPITGAWIETHHQKVTAHNMLVAPITGAWIETVTLIHSSAVLTVAPITGAWIETTLILVKV